MYTAKENVQWCTDEGGFNASFKGRRRRCNGGEGSPAPSIARRTIAAAGKSLRATCPRVHTAIGRLRRIGAVELVLASEKGRAGIASSPPWAHGQSAFTFYRGPLPWRPTLRPRRLPEFACNAAGTRTCVTSAVSRLRSGGDLFHQRPGRNSPGPWEWDVAPRGELSWGAGTIT
jgi:hypothetical protein